MDWPFYPTIQLTVVGNQPNFGGAWFLHEKRRADPLSPFLNLDNDSGREQLIQQSFGGIPVVDMDLPSGLDVARFDVRVVHQLKMDGVALHSTACRSQGVG